jgi:hypothetical protein
MKVGDSVGVRSFEELYRDILCYLNVPIATLHSIAEMCKMSAGKEFTIVMLETNLETNNRLAHLAPNSPKDFCPKTFPVAGLYLINKGEIIL